VDSPEFSDTPANFTADSGHVKLHRSLSDFQKLSQEDS
jgi:hypothetical protein